MTALLARIIFSLLVFAFAASVSCEEKTNTDENDNELDYMLQPYETEFFDFLDAPHEVISSGVEIAAQGLDLFFADENAFGEATGSYAKFSTTTVFSHGGEYSTTNDIRLKVDLKQTKKKLKLLLESDTDKGIQTGVKTTETPGQEQNDKTSLFAALEKEISKKEKWHTKASLGIKLRVPLDPYLRIRANKNFRLGGANVRFTETIFWFNSKGAGASSLLEIDYSISKNLLFRSSTSELWTDFVDYHEDTQTFSLYHELSDRRAVSYNAGISAISEPTFRMTSYYTSMGYRQKIHREWLYVQITPALTFSVGNGYKVNRSLLISLEMVFGNKYVHRPPKDED